MFGVRDWTGLNWHVMSMAGLANEAVNPTNVTVEQYLPALSSSEGPVYTEGGHRGTAGLAV